MLKPEIEFDNKFPEEIKKQLEKKLKKINSAYVTIGVHEGAGTYSKNSENPTVAQVALWNEFGTQHIPQRSFIRSALNENLDKINQWREEAVNQILSDEITVEKALESIGFRIQILIQNKIKSNVPPPNAASTLARKYKEGVASNTLIETGLLLRSITYKVNID